MVRRPRSPKTEVTPRKQTNAVAALMMRRRIPNDPHGDGLADELLQARLRKLLLLLHHDSLALFLHLERHVVGELRRGRSLLVRVGEDAEMVELRLLQERQQRLELFFVLARES